MSDRSNQPDVVFRPAQPFPQAGRPRGAGSESSQPGILIVSADEGRRAGLSDIFESEGFVAHETPSQAAAERAIELHRIDLIVIDGRFWDAGAVAVCARLSAHQPAPIIILSDEVDVTDRIIALEVGAADLLERQFDRRELVARARALLRRSGRTTYAAAQSKQAVLYLRSRTLVGGGGARVPLPANPFALLWIFASQPGQLVTRDFAANLLDQPDLSDAHFRTCIARLRRKFAEAGIDPGCLTSVRAEGYALDPSYCIEVRDEIEHGFA